MINIAFLLLYAISPISNEKTLQQPDVLFYEGKKLHIEASWAYASTVQLYYYQNGKPYPFDMISTANYRGHIAYMSVQSDMLLLDSLDIDDTIEKPSKFEIADQNKEESTLTIDWFTGIMVGRENYWSGREDEVVTHYFQIENGKVINHDQHQGYWSDTKLAKMSRNYQAFYSQMENDVISIKDEVCQLNTGIGKPSPIFDYYGSSLSDYPYNWTNLERSGAPKVKWTILEDILYVEDIYLLKGIGFEPEMDTLNLTSEFTENMESGRVKANWVSGVFLVIHGKEGPDPYYPGMTSFLPKKFTLIRFKNGYKQEEATLGIDFNPEKIPENIPKKAKRLINDYFN